MSLKSVVVVSPVSERDYPRYLPAMEQIANRAIACHVIEALLRAGTTGIAVVAPRTELADVRNYVDAGLGGVGAIEYLPYQGPIDLLGALEAAASFVGDEAAVVHFADGLLDQPLDEFVDRLTEPGAPDLLLLLHRSVDRDNRLTQSIHELLGVAELEGSRKHLALAGVCLFGRGAVRQAVDYGSQCGGTVDLGTVADELFLCGATVDAAVVRDWRRYQRDPSDLLELNRLVLDRQDVAGGAPCLADSRIEGRVIIDPTANVSSSIILGPCIIGPEARITNSYIGPYTSVGAGVEIEGAEVVGSIVAEGVRIMHIQGRIEGSTIGRRASIFRDFSLPRAMRLHVGEGVELALD
jgi:glucose-1-phosphate thymidylyltransferase